MSFNKKEIQSKFKALNGIFGIEGIKTEDLHIFFNSSPSLAMICDPETGNAAMANAFADLSNNYGWTGHKPGSGLSDLAPSILHYNWF
jgi:hypothetical protein